MKIPIIIGVDALSMYIEKNTKDCVDLSNFKTDEKSTKTTRNMKFITFIFFNLSSFLVLAQNSPIDSIPFKLEKDNRIYTYLKVNKSDSLYFLVDTGASDMVINSEILPKINMNFNSTITNMGTTGENQVKLSTENTVIWGTQELNNLEFISIPYLNEKWDGVLGLSVLKRFVVKIDYSKMLIYLYDKNNYQNVNTNKLKINYAHNVPIINVKLKTIDHKTHHLRLEVDTGSDRIIDISTRYVNTHKLLHIYPKAFATSTVTSSDGNSGTILNNYFPLVTISEFEFYKIPGGLAQIEFGIMNTDDIDGIIGNWFLKRFNLTFDFKNDYLYLEPNNNLHTPYYEFLTH